MTKPSILKHRLENNDQYHHPKEKMAQLDDIRNHSGMEQLFSGEILEVFAGDKGNLTPYYAKSGHVFPMTPNTTGDSYTAIHAARGKGIKCDIIDIDPYGDPYKIIDVAIEMLKPISLLIVTWFKMAPRNDWQKNINLRRHGHQHAVSIGDVSEIVMDAGWDEGFVLSPMSTCHMELSGIWRIPFLAKFQGKMKRK